MNEKMAHEESLSDRIELDEIFSDKPPITIVMDCDGILTPPFFGYTKENGKSIKFFSVNDSLTLKFLRERHADKVLDVVLLTGDATDGNSIVARRCEEIGLRHVGCQNHLKYFWIRDNVGFSNVAYIGDDIFDIPSLSEARWSATVRDAPQVLMDFVDYISVQNGGHSAFTDIVFALLEKEFNVDVSESLAKYVLEQEETWAKMQIDGI